MQSAQAAQSEQLPQAEAMTRLKAEEEEVDISDVSTDNNTDSIQ